MIFSRKWLAAGMPCRAAGMSGRTRREVVDVVVVVEREGEEKLRRVCRG